jgi:kynureninase
VIAREDAVALDASDPLASFRDRFAIGDETQVYADGNSLGRLPLATLGRLEEVIAREWGLGLVGSWEHWIDLPSRVGDLLATALMGAGPGQVAVGDSTTVNLYKLVSAAVDARPGRPVLLTDDDNFPTDRYVLESVAAQRGLELQYFSAGPVEGPTVSDIEAAVAGAGPDRVALVCLSHVAYRSGALADMAGISTAVRAAGALSLWDLSHSVGSVPVDLTGAGADLATGCTYKYVNAGPGAPAFAYVRPQLQHQIRQPIWGWFGQRDQFEMGHGYQPVAGIGQLASGTPDVLGLTAVEVGAAILAEAGTAALRSKSIALTDLLIELHDDWLAPLGWTVGTPRDGARRGGHVALCHPDARTVAAALRVEANVIPDFRAPDSVRLGFAPIYSRYVDVWDAMDRLRKMLARDAHRGHSAPAARVL